MKRALWIGLLCSMSATVGYASSEMTPAPFQQDLSYERMLKYQSGPDHSITPASVLRWMSGHSNDPSSKIPSTEFAPTVNVVQTRVRIIAAFNYKF